MDPTRGDSRYNLNYGMGGIGLSLADQADLYGNPAAVLASGGGGGLNNRPPSGGLIQSMGGGGGGSGSGRSSSGLMHHSSTGGNSSNQCQTLGGSGGNSNQQQQQQQQQQQSSRGIKRTSSGCYEDHHRNSAGQQMSSQGLQNLDNCGPGGQHSGNGTPQDMVGGGSGGGGGGGSGNPDENYTSLQTNKKSPPANGKKTKGRVKIKMEYIDNKLRRYTTFSKRKTGIMKKAYELSTLTGTQVMLLVASETGHVYTFATRKLQPMITSEAGKQLIQTCLNSPDPPPTGGTGDQRMSATGFEETELSYNIADEDSKVRQLIYSHGHHGHAHLGHPQAPSHYGLEQSLMQSPYSGGQPSPLSHAQAYAPHGGHTHHSHVPHVPHSMAHHTQR
ncbi:serum response factor homolog [Condylostylus longicornis]|uniref:serum response factor homolog n=1 Tax=Condylostylus longicornis TaxID=2530218 RepID=UPI00244E0839|nr:serum response factor homolog [Condylostylus longicornis]XP_055384628.1 serum response factor homolog [Condylostylus longicornis]XP_055384629.1 serum response factor homolog [Condylostylus longicornis]XP_055384630.1 serum response factor homolog [Condylostylus longicornis]XP_055384631.1 serum response factor homolog [Condylostylus longicornis]